MLPLTGLGLVFGQPSLCFFWTKFFDESKVKIVKRKRHKTTLREELEDLNDVLDLTEARVRDEGKPRLKHAEVKKRYGLK